jgi:hypothetical protein
MSAALFPYGLKPVFHPTGLDRATLYTGPVSLTNNIYQYSPVTVDATNGLSVKVSGAVTNIYGVADGFEYTDASGRRAVSKWVGSALGTLTNVYAWVWTDPETVYEAQANGAVVSTSIGREFNILNAQSGQIIGNGGLGQSTAVIDSTGPVASGTQGDVLVIGLGRAPDNAWGDSYTQVQVKIAREKLVAPIPSTIV